MSDRVINYTFCCEQRHETRYAQFLLLIDIRKGVHECNIYNDSKSSYSFNNANGRRFSVLPRSLNYNETPPASDIASQAFKNRIYVHITAYTYIHVYIRIYTCIHYIPYFQLLNGFKYYFCRVIISRCVSNATWICCFSSDRFVFHDQPVSGSHSHAIFRDQKTGNGENENGTSSFSLYQHADLFDKQLRTVVLLRPNGEVSTFLFALTLTDTGEPITKVPYSLFVRITSRVIALLGYRSIFIFFFFSVFLHNVKLNKTGSLPFLRAFARIRK